MDQKRREYFKNYVDQRKRISISLCSADFRKVEYLAEKMEMKPTSFVGHLVQQKLGKNPTLAPEIHKELTELTYLIRNIANNVNQIAHRSNTLKVMVDENALLMELKRLEDVIKGYVAQKVDS
ncbi:plasmid mobilization relaxosome protein MobC [Pseudoalteromonas sp. Of7M-16]|uniref:plasmid mobilization relaxosome protein MobC n=1 Tax=Pseudoalteromonas sp. Of7M-16 TaxID=2917756 RepID=UPI001EF5138F|nr:plasmid mobilization relaxosome protein MobC [Pseudoalteromonas sp. Of7M-16]MCG7549035.1 MobC family plasmid mobilization relaxosome protein [Pseudoalteromonas sp. Of7M-16]